jgi:hypothetical protein
MGRVDSRAMAEGKAETLARTAWTLDAGRLRLRCLRDGAAYSLQMRSGKGSWLEVGRGRDAAALLLRVTKTAETAAELSRLDARAGGST